MKNPPIPVERILLNINIEQIGSKNRDFRGIWAIGSPRFREAFFESGNFLSGTELKYDSIDEMADVIKDCDTYSFYSKNIPSIILGSGGFKEHHTPQDKIDLIDFDHLLAATKFLYSFIIELGNVQ